MSALTTHTLPLYRDSEFGGIYLGITIDDFNKLGFAYGDSVNISFSNGYKLCGVPYYNGYYARMGKPVLVAYPGNKFVKAALNFGDSLWHGAGVTKEDTGIIELSQAGAFRDVQDSFNITYTNNRSDYASNEIFANFRALKGGRLKERFAYRSASPIDDEYGRATYVSQLVEQAGIRFVLDLSEGPQKMHAYMQDAHSKGIDVSHFERLLADGAVEAIALMANYPSEEFARKLSAGLVAMSRREGPYLLHCVEGKDRTGFVCMLIEALAGATYDEMRVDYMTTFDNYYGITEQSDPKKYRSILQQNFHGMLECLAAAAQPNADTYIESARAYLQKGGMSVAQIDALVSRICVE